MLKKISILFIFVLLGGVIFGPIYGLQESLVLANNSDNITSLCEGKYDFFKKFGNKILLEKYSHLNYISSCLTLFEDPNWSFNGKEKIDSYYENYDKAISKINPSITNFDNQKLSIKNISTSKIGFESYALKFRVCSDKTISEPKFFVVTDKEYFLAKANRTLKENQCNFALIYATSNNPEKTFVIPFDGNYVPSKYLTVKSFF